MHRENHDEVADSELLRLFVMEHRQSAFTALVSRHLPLVHRCALLRVGGDAHGAADVVQTVFTDLARKAPDLLRHRNLPGWLYQSTRYASAAHVRAQRRRREHEGKAVPEEHKGPDWARLAPFLDEELQALPELDRSALLLHFFEGHKFPEVGARLGLSADAVRMRVNRSLDKIRSSLGKAGLGSSAAVLTEILGGSPLLAAPEAQALSIAARALAKAAAAPKTLLLPTLKTLGLAGLGLALGGLCLFLWNPFSANKESEATLVSQESVPQDEATMAQLPVQSEVSAQPGKVAPTAATPKVAPLFSSLSPPEKRILWRLWNLEKTRPPKPGAAWCIDVPADKPQRGLFVAARRSLRQQGLVSVTRIGLKTILSPAGRAFCEANDAAFAEFGRAGALPW